MRAIRLRWPRSLRARLLWLLFGAIAATAAVQVTTAYRTAMAEADEIFDYHLQHTAMSLRTGLPSSEWEEGGRHTGRLPSSDDDDDFIVQVWTVDGLLVFRSVETPALPQRAVLGFSNATLGSTRYRVFVLASPTHVIEVAQDLEVRREIAAALALRTMAPIALMTPLLLLMVWWVVGASLAPVARLRTELAVRRAEDLSRVSESGWPEEISPLIRELNLLFRRVRGAFDTQKSFVADAAHELRSPLAALKLQVQGMRRAPDEATREVMANRLDSGIDRATHLVEQLLVLARQEAGSHHGEKPETLALADLARLEIADAAPAAIARDIDLGLLHADEARIDGQREALHILLRNLIDNAIKYTPRGGTVDVEIARDDRAVVLRVQDSGRGIPEADRRRVLDRFYRVAGVEGAGSGLGLAIVKAIADLHGVALSLKASERLGGLCVELRFAESP